MKVKKYLISTLAIGRYFDKPCIISVHCTVSDYVQGNDSVGKAEVVQNSNSVQFSTVQPLPAPQLAVPAVPQGGSYQGQSPPPPPPPYSQNQRY